MTIVSPSLLSANFLDLRKDVEIFNQSKALWLHYDVMDGQFVPNISFGVPILKQVCAISDKFMDVHIMVENPTNFIDYFSGCRVDNFTFHLEAVKDNDEAIELIDKIHNKGIMASISIKPKTPIEALEGLLDKVDMVLIMSVEPGFGGQKFMPDMLEKCDWLDQYRKDHSLNYLIEIDGGINQQTGLLAKEHHVDVLVAGSYCFNHPQGFDFAVESLLD